MKHKKNTGFTNTNKTDYVWSSDQRGPLWLANSKALINPCWG